MEHELKIIMKFHTEDIEHDQDYPIFNHTTIVSLDGNPVGMIQDIKIKASVAEELPEIEIIFPNLFSHEIDPSYTQRSSLAKELKNNIEKLERIPNVRVKLADLGWDK